MAAKNKQSGLIIPSSPGALEAPPEWADEFKDQLERDAAAATGGSGWPWLSTKTMDSFKLGDVDYGSTLEVIVLGAIRVNSYYAKAYDPNAVTGPDCFALNTGLNEAKMGPPEDLKSKESDKCIECWANAYGSDPVRKKGKACKNQVRLAVLYHEEGQNFERVAGARLNLPPTAQTPWSQYTNSILENLHRPLLSVVTRIHIEKDDNTQFKLSFELGGAYNDPDMLRILRGRAAEAVKELEQTPDASAAEAPAPAKRGGKKKVGTRAVTRKPVRKRTVKSR